ncbi:hypothetical protein HIM_08544 [Hirsutella minnesotensis 3608]|uniref:BRCT domain-containing protein n=1 Tax=Hirsutella minnesotensis 3608 TaxID=1043627 RepID=A0A0F8A3M5_9HYPO|nr:hypothetical protein HIM_08544 [Hirsutella minnesotensis 3608]
MASPQDAKDEQYGVDPSQPFKGIVVCCTSIPPEQRTDIANKVAELGGIHKYDLTPDATHLVVGDYDTPKYRHVARERQDIKAMDAAWIEAVSDLWKHDEEIDFAALERLHQLKPLEKCGAETASPGNDHSARQSLLICLTGFGDQRDEIAEKIASNGGRYTGDLTRRCTHLIVSKPEGKKFTAAKSWNVYTVTLDWLYQSVERGMILEEARFDPLLPSEEQGVGAWVKRDPNRTSLGKRSRSAMSVRPEEGVRKLRKTASMKLNSQRDNLWGDILGRSTSRDYSFQEPQHDEQKGKHAPPREAASPEEGIFSRCVFAISGFSQTRKKVLEETIATLNGTVVPSVDAITSPTARQKRFLIVPQSSQPDTHPHITDDSVQIITEFYVERCLHNKRFILPDEHVLGRPFPLFPIHGFSGLTICSAAFTGLELSQMARSVAQLGAKFEEEFRRTTSLVVCKSLQSMRKEKLRYALEWGVPIVSAEWLWECISTGFNIPIDGYIFPEIKKQYTLEAQLQHARGVTDGKRLRTQQSESVQTATRRGAPRPPAEAGLDATAFEHDSPHNGRTGKSAQRLTARGPSVTSADFMTTKTHPDETFAMEPSAPLEALSSARLNKSPSPPKQPSCPVRTTSEPSRTVDKAAVSTRRPSAPPPDAAKEHASAEAEAAQAKRKAEEEAAEEARKQAKEAERQALSSKLSTLIQSATGDSDASESRSQGAAPRPRRRQVFGRAISNASNASSAASIEGGRPVPDVLRSVTAGGSDDDFAAAGHDDGAQATPPPATQLEYHDPEVLKSKAALVSKMMGSKGAAAAVASASHAPSVGSMGGRALRKR